MTRKHNKLISQKSPYLLQHADNPVDWYPWAEEAFEKAKKENKPVLLSIGYSTCHWCHVMAHESFEDPEVAKLMNETFVSVKVDREERPDIDRVYMTVCQMMTGSGGWPLTIIMTPNKEPFFAATYIPKETRFGRVGMLILIPRIKELWSTRQAEVLSSATQITASLQNTAPGAPGEGLNERLLHLAYEQLSERFNEDHGGFGSAPKFPTPHNLLFLLKYWKRTSNEKALNMVEETLQSIRRGGIYDHIGFGFHRYSTDSRWLVPHFEKMLYDQALLAIAYTEAYQATKKAEYPKTAHEIFTYVMRDMTSPEGAFYSAEDADSEGEEGKFYLWTNDEIQEVLSHEGTDLAIRLFNITANGNFTDDVAGKKTGHNILHLTKSIDELASDLSMFVPDLRARIEEVREELFAYRKKRIHPHKDDKILTDWNGLMIAALAKGAQVFDEPKYASAARRAADFILKNVRTSEGRLLHRYRDGEAALTAHVDDYAFLIYGLLELYELTFEVYYLKTALELNEDLIRHFWDHENGGFYFTADDGERLLVRQKEIYDGAVPSGNSVAMLNLLRLGRITASANFEEKAARIGQAFYENVSQLPSAYTQLMAAADFAIGPSYEVVIAGDLQADDTRQMLDAIRGIFVPNKIVILHPTDQKPPLIDDIVPFIKDHSSIDGKATAYICLNYSCQLPTKNIGSMLELLGS
ncbi:MAG TPA: thioredoxin domain-containing protein [Dehalococcoidia bacterium]|nr:thioredoxin domain-containing protein [Dehalococcoidia bacterium]